MEFINKTGAQLDADLTHTIIGAASIIGADKVEANVQCVWFHFGSPSQAGYRTAAVTLAECFDAKSPAKLVGRMFRQQLDRVNALLPK